MPGALSQPTRLLLAHGGTLGGHEFLLIAAPIVVAIVVLSLMQARRRR